MIGKITKLIPLSKEGRRRRDGSVDHGGYGFVKGEDGFDRFFHGSSDVIEGNFDAAFIGQTVAFEPFDGGKAGNGKRAIKVCLLVRQ